MNCSQARILLAAYRDLTHEQMDTAALEVHLSTCAACKDFLAQSSVIGEQLRALPTIKPVADAHTRLMKALVVEHAQFIKQTPLSAQSTPIPAFLIPYVKEHAQEIASADSMAAFSTADTGPLPLLRTPEKYRRRSMRMNHFSVIGLAAAFLMVIMAGGLTSLVILANRGIHETGTNVASVAQLSQLTLTNYTTATTYPHIASVVANRQNIYYSSYANDNNNWMLFALDNQTRVSTPLLTSKSSNPLLVLASSDNWLIWLQLNQPQLTANKNAQHHTIAQHSVRTWTLQATYLGIDPASTLTVATPIILSKGTFDATTVPTWVHTPIQGTWLAQNLLLATTIDQKGVAHLNRYELNAEKSPLVTELATASDGHILTSPTATSDGSDIYWSEEWVTANTLIHSNIWAQKITEAVPPLQGRWIRQATSDVYLLRADETSFHPQVVNDTLFLLNVKKTSIANSTATNVTADSTPMATPTNQQQAAAALVRINPTYYAAPLDAQLQGTLQAVSTSDDTSLQLAINTDDSVLAPQAGSRFIMWQSVNNKAIGMYDAVAKQSVVVGRNTIPSTATLLAVNGDTTVWVPNANTIATNSDIPANSATFNTFSWPNQATSTTTP